MACNLLDNNILNCIFQLFFVAFRRLIWYFKSLLIVCYFCAGNKTKGIDFYGY